MRHGSLFSGIGGFDLASEWMGWENIFHCEINEFGRKVLKYYWPKAISYEDITKTDFSIHRGNIDIITGGFPCQPYSQAGQRKGKEDERHLWPAMLDAIKAIQPSWIVGENVSGLLNWNGGMVLNEIKTDLESAGFEVFPPCVLPACGKDAPHRRDRVWIIAHHRDRGVPKTLDSQKRGEQQGLLGKIGNTGQGIELSSQNNATSDTNSDGHELRGFGEDRQEEEESESKQDKRERVWSDDRGTCEQGTTPNTESNGDRGGLHGMERKDGSKWESKEHRENNLQSGDDGKERNATHTNYKGLEGSSIAFSNDAEGWKEQGGRIKQSSVNAWRTLPTKAWQDFPTQSPLCRGNDGISGELAGITFSKHRTESIKAYGNSIVPQVVYEIFKTIEHCNNL